MVANGDELVSPQPDESGFRSFDNAAADVVLAISYNSSGSRCAIAAADHRVRVHDCEDQTSGVHPSLLDQWRAHDAEILDVQWLPFPHTRYLATTGADNKIKIWLEDPSQLPGSGRRFRCIMSQTPASHVPYTSFSFHSTRKQDLYLALFTHNGLLELLEPAEFDSLSTWRLIDHLYPFGRFHPGSEPRFCLSFQPAPTTTTPVLALSASHLLKIYLTHPLPLNHPSPTPDLQLLESLAHSLPRTLQIASLAWQPTLLPPASTIALGCTDGTLRLVELTPPPKNSSRTPDPTQLAKNGPSTSSFSDDYDDNDNDTTQLAPNRAPTPAVSSLSTLTSSLAINPAQRPLAPPHLRPSALDVGTLTHDEQGGAVARVDWTPDGSSVASSGEAGELVVWRRGIAGGWVEWSRTWCEE